MFLRFATDGAVGAPTVEVSMFLPEFDDTPVILFLTIGPLVSLALVFAIMSIRAWIITRRRKQGTREP